MPRPAPGRAGKPRGEGENEEKFPSRRGTALRRCRLSGSPGREKTRRTPRLPPGRRRRTGNCPAPREVLPLLMKADVQASTLPGDSARGREDVHAVRKRLPESHAARKRAGPHGCARGKTAIQIRKAPSPAALPARGKTRDPASAPKERTEGDCFSPGLRAMAETKSRSATRRNDGAIPRPSDGRAGFFLPIGSEWLTTGAWTPCEP